MAPCCEANVDKPAPGEDWKVAEPAPAAATAPPPSSTAPPPRPARRPPRRHRPGLTSRPAGRAPSRSDDGRPALRIDVLTLFPGLFDGFLGESILKRAIAKGLVEVKLWDVRDWAEGKHRQVDDRPFGGGPGMVLMAPPVVSAVEAVRGSAEPTGRLIALTPSGRTCRRIGSESWRSSPG